MSSILKARVRFTKQIYPKNKINNGDWGCLEADIVEILEDSDIKNIGFIKVVGNFPSLNSNGIYKIIATKTSNKYGIAYELDFICTEYNLKNKEEQYDFLKEILTDKQFKSIIETLENPIDILEKENIEELIKVKGIGLSTANKLIDKYKQNKDYSQLYIKLKNIGLSKKMIEKLIGSYKSPDIIVEKIQSNPYILADEVNGIGFKKADEIALKMGVELDSLNRIKSFICFYLETEAKKGHSWIFADSLMSEINEVLGSNINKKNITESYKELLEEKIIWADKEKGLLALNFYKDLEDNTAKEIKRLLKSDKVFEVDNVYEKIKDLEIKQGWELTDEQKDFINLALKNNFIVLSGNAGSGKSTIVNTLINLLSDYSSVGTALAGKAADRLSEVADCETMTIHRLLEWEKGEFLRNKENPIEYDIVIVDEVSMLGGVLFYQLIQAISSNTKLILIGDDAQLEAIGECNIFSDLLKSDCIPKKKLTKIHRQAKKSAIITESTKVRNGLQLTTPVFEDKETRGELMDFIIDVHSDKILTAPKAINYFKEYMEYKDILNVQIIAPMKSRGDISIYELNQTAQQLYNPLKKQNYKDMFKDGKKYQLREFDKIIIKKNNYSTTNIDNNIYPIYNGNVGIIEKINSTEEIIVIRLKNGVKVLIPFKNSDSIELGYAVTAHSYQGSQCEIVIGCIDYSAYSLLTKELLYTMITRASKKFILCAENNALHYAIDTTYVSNKQTFLKFFLKSS